VNQTPAVHIDRPQSAPEISRPVAPLESHEGPGTSLRPRALEVIFWGGLVAGTLDAIDAMVWVTAIGVSIPRLFKFIASGLIGMAAFKGGMPAVALGVVLHFTIATGAATVYYLLSLRLPALLQRPFLSGPIFGVGAYIFMHYVVLPLSAVPAQAPPTFVWVANQLFSHTIFVGLPIALIARRSARAHHAEN
jgi:uncharacterized membrane protein YagU involved in acid resistance